MKPKEVQKLLRDRRAVSVVISNIILVGAVIAVGFTVVAWTSSRSIAYMTQYSESVNSDVDKLR
jgi:predicted PurR-regulated permease PerM